jgi:arylsulfatase A-like enzyme
VLITADDLGWHDLSCTGNTNIETPNIDRLATDGVRFTNAFVTSSSCSPSRASLITGQYPHTHGVDGLTTLYPDKELPRGYQTLPALLVEQGYHTAIEGKWHVAPSEQSTHYGYTEHLGTPIWYQLIRDTDRTIDFLERNRDRRFYLELNYMNTHRHVNSGRFQFDPDYILDPDAIDVPEYMNLPDWPEIRFELAMFYSQTLKMDAMVGEVLDALERLGLADDTLVLFLSDNGPPFPGNKLTLYGRGIGTPLLFRWPRLIQEARVIDGFVNEVDLMPTLLDLVGLPIPDDLQGRSFYRSLWDESTPVPADAVFSEMTYHVDYLPMRAVRTRELNYIRNYSDDPIGLDQCVFAEWAQRLAELPNHPWLEPRVEEELYDLTIDPHEQTNLATDPAYSSALESMRNRLDDHMARTADPYLGAPFEST